MIFLMVVSVMILRLRDSFEASINKIDSFMLRETAISLPSDKN